MKHARGSNSNDSDEQPQRKRQKKANRESDDEDEWRESEDGDGNKDDASDAVSASSDNDGDEEDEAIAEEDEEGEDDNGVMDAETAAEMAQEAREEANKERRTFARAAGTAFQRVLEGDADYACGLTKLMRKLTAAEGAADDFCAGEERPLRRLTRWCRWNLGNASARRCFPVLFGGGGEVTAPHVVQLWGTSSSLTAGIARSMTVRILSNFSFTIFAGSMQTNGLYLVCAWWRDSAHGRDTPPKRRSRVVAVAVTSAAVTVFCSDDNVVVDDDGNGGGAGRTDALSDALVAALGADRVTFVATPATTTATAVAQRYTRGFGWAAARSIAVLQALAYGVVSTEALARFFADGDALALVGFVRRVAILRSRSTRHVLSRCDDADLRAMRDWFLPAERAAAARKKKKDGKPAAAAVVVINGLTATYRGDDDDSDDSDNDDSGAPCPCYKPPPGFSAFGPSGFVVRFEVLVDDANDGDEYNLRAVAAFELPCASWTAVVLQARGVLRETGVDPDVVRVRVLSLTYATAARDTPKDSAVAPLWCLASQYGVALTSLASVAAWSIVDGRSFKNPRGGNEDRRLAFLRATPDAVAWLNAGGALTLAHGDADDANAADDDDMLWRTLLRGVSGFDVAQRVVAWARARTFERVRSESGIASAIWPTDQAAVVVELGDAYSTAQFSIAFRAEWRGTRGIGAAIEAVVARTAAVKAFCAALLLPCDRSSGAYGVRVRIGFLQAAVDHRGEPAAPHMVWCDAPHVALGSNGDATTAKQRHNALAAALGRKALEGVDPRVSVTWRGGAAPGGGTDTCLLGGKGLWPGDTWQLPPTQRALHEQARARCAAIGLRQRAATLRDRAKYASDAMAAALRDLAAAVNSADAAPFLPSGSEHACAAITAAASDVTSAAAFTNVVTTVPIIVTLVQDLKRHALGAQALLDDVVHHLCWSASGAYKKKQLTWPYESLYRITSTAAYESTADALDVAWAAIVATATSIRVENLLTNKVGAAAAVKKTKKHKKTKKDKKDKKGKKNKKDKKRTRGIDE